MLQTARRALSALGRPTLSVADPETYVGYVDGLRGLAILGVLAVHVAQHVSQYNFYAFENPVLRCAVYNGARGVQLFFIVSAFTLFRSSQRRFAVDRRPILAFYLRRFFRILPLFWLVATANVISRDVTLERALPTYLFYFGFIRYRPEYEIVPGSWTLFVEETFYLLLPWVFGVISSLRRAVGLWILLLGVSVIWRAFAYNWGVPSENFFIGWHPLANWFCFGLGICVVFAAERVERAGWWLDLYVIASTAVVFLIPFFADDIGIQGFHLALLVLACTREGSPLRRLTESSLLRRFGVGCYSIYLLHFPLLDVADRWQPDLWNALGMMPLRADVKFFVWFALIAFVCLVGSQISFRYFEKPCVDLGKRAIRRVNARLDTMRAPSLPRIEIAFALLASATSVVCLTLLWRSDLTSWDMPGHLASAEYAASYFFPWPQGWNDLVLGGYPQSYYYPPLFNWLVGAGAGWLPVATSFKLVLSAALLATPPALLWFFRATGLSRERASLAGLAALALMTSSRFEIGGELYGTLSGGLAPAGLAAPLALCAAAGFLRGTRSARALAFGSLCAGLTLLCHVFTAVSLAVWLVTIFFISYAPAGAGAIRRYVFAGTGAMIIGSAYLLPFFVYRGNTTGHFAPSTGFALFLGRMGWPAMIFVCALVAALVRHLRRRDPSVHVMFLLALAVWICVELVHDLGELTELRGVHAYRMTFFFYLPAVAFTAVHWAERIRPAIVEAACAALLMAGIVSFPRAAAPIRSRSIDVPLSALPHDRRGFVHDGLDGPLTEIRSPHLLSTTLTRAGIPLAQGLFVESSAPSTYVQSLGLELFPSYFSWGVTTKPAVFDAIGRHARMLGVQWLLTRTPVSERVGGQLNIKRYGRIDVTLTVDDAPAQRIPYHYYELDNALVELPTKVRLVRPADLEDATQRQWMSPDLVDVVHIASDNAVLAAPPRETDRVSVEWLSTERLRVVVDATDPRWVFLKVPYFQNWHAYTSDGELQLFRAAPGFMAFCGNGEVELRFERGLAERVGATTTLFGVGVALLMLVRARTRRQDRMES